MQVEVTQDQLNTMATQNQNFDANEVVSNTEEQKPLSDRDFKIAFLKAQKERKEIIRRNKELIADKELEVAYWKAEADLMRYRFEKMDFFLKNLEIEPKYLMEVEKIKAADTQNTVEKSKILD